jgi:hypothetical protein
LVLDGAESRYFLSEIIRPRINTVAQEIQRAQILSPYRPALASALASLRIKDNLQSGEMSFDWLDRFIKLAFSLWRALQASITESISALI